MGFPADWDLSGSYTKLATKHYIKWVFSNMVALVRFHMVSFVHLINFLNHYEKDLKENIKNQGQASLYPKLGLTFQSSQKKCLYFFHSNNFYYCSTLVGH